MHINYKNTEIHYTARGEGNPLVLLHGFLESSGIWEEFIPGLVKKRQVISIDLPGHGKSGNFADVHSMKEMAEAVKAVLDNLNISKAHIAGHSMGGYVSLEILRNFPTLPQSVALVNSTPEADSEERKENRDRAISLVLKNKSAYINMAISNLMTPENYRRFKPETESLKTSALNISEQAVIAALQGMKIRTDNTKLFSVFQGNKFVLAGEQDPVMDYERIKKVSERCNSKFFTVSNGHLSYIENKESLNKFLHFID